MQTNVHEHIVVQFTRSLDALKNILKKSREFALERKFDENNFLQLKLAPDMFPLVKQVQIVTDTAKGAVARLSGKSAPIFEDNEKTLNDVLNRIDATIHFISEFKPADFKDYQNAKISFPWYPGKFIMGEDLLTSHAIPNFYFHLTTTYALLRSVGVNIGKTDFLGAQNWQKEV
jgi:hypothetical protein